MDSKISAKPGSKMTAEVTIAPAIHLSPPKIGTYYQVKAYRPRNFRQVLDWNYLLMKEEALLEKFRDASDEEALTFLRRQKDELLEGYEAAGETESWNLITTQGATKLLDATFKTGLASPSWNVGLVKTKGGSFNIADTLASHSGWTEAAVTVDYSGNRPALTLGAITGTNPASVDNTASKASFTIIGTWTVFGAFICDSASGTGGTLYGINDFSPTLSVQANYVVTAACTLTTAAS